MANAKAEGEQLPDPLEAGERLQRYAPSLGAFETLSKFQWASPQKISAHQEACVSALVAHAMAKAPFYRERLDVLRGPGGIDLSRWLEVPVLTREDVVGHKDALTASEYPQEHGKARLSRSSGTTGGRVEILRSEFQENINACCQFRFLHDSGVDWSHNLTTIRSIDPNITDAEPGDARGPDPEWTRWGPPWLPFAQRGQRDALSVHTPPGQQLDWLEARAPVYVNTMPSNLLALAHHARDTGRRVSGISGALTGGDVLTADIRNEVSRWLGIAIIDTLASAECGGIAVQCPEGTGNYHMDAESVVVEVLKEDGTPCRPGETGLLTVTPMYSFAMPLIRYRLKDWVTVGEPCPCGRGLPVISRIVGRDSTLFLFADGVRKRLEVDSDTLFRLIGPRRCQIVQTSPECAEVRIADTRSEHPADTAGMAAYVRQLAGRDMDVSCRMVPVLGAAPSGKFDLVVRSFDQA